MFTTSVYRSPSMSVIGVQTINEILMHPEAMFKKGVTLAAGYPNVMVGDVLAQITSGVNTGKYRRYGSALVKTNATSATVALTDTRGGVVASPFVPGDIVNVGADLTNTIVSVNNTNGTITLGGSITVVAGESIALTTDDGSGVADCIAARPVFSAIYNPELPEINYLLDADYQIDAIFQGILKKAYLRGLDAGAITDLNGQTIASLGAFIVR